MKNYKKLLPFLAVGFLVTSCGNQTSRIRRVTFKETNYDNALAVHNKIKENQVNKETETSTLFNSGKINYKYSFSANGVLRYDSYTFHNVNLSFSAYLQFSWNLEKNYIKIEGENEVTHYMYSDKDQAFYCLRLYHVNGEEKKRKFIETEKFEEYGIADYTIDRVNYFTTLLPIGFSVTAGLDGANYTILPGYLLPQYNADAIFDEETHQLFEDVGKKYKNENKGFYLNQSYGTDSDSTLCATIKSRLCPGDFTEKHDGELYVDAFASFKDNFISQFELMVNGELKVYRVDDVDVKINAYMSEEVTQQDIVPDVINPDEYIERT